MRRTRPVMVFNLSPRIRTTSPRKRQGRSHMIMFRCSSLYGTGAFFSPPPARAARGGEGSGVGGASAYSTLAWVPAEPPPTPRPLPAAEERGEGRRAHWSLWREKAASTQTAPPSLVERARGQ